MITLRLIIFVLSSSLMWLVLYIYSTFLSISVKIWRLFYTPVIMIWRIELMSNVFGFKKTQAF